MLVSIGDLAQSFVMKRQTTQIKGDLQRLVTELSSGVVSDPAARMRGDLAPLGAIDSSLSRLAGYDAVTRDLSLVLQARQTVLGQIDSLAAQAASRLIGVTQGAGAGMDAALQETATDFATAISALNQRFADRSLFAGAAVGSAALRPAQDILTAAAAAIAPAQGAAAVEAALDAWLADPAGFAATAYLGGGVAPPVAIAAGDLVAGDVTAMDSGLHQTVKGLLMGALARDAMAGDPAGRTQMARRAGEVLATAAQDRAALSARIGLTEGRIAAAEARNSAEATALGIARTGLVQADPYETATALQDAETRLDLLFTLTARLSRLSLADRL